MPKGFANYVADLKNNIFSTKGGGLPVYVGVPLTNLDWDYNCYYTTGNVIGSYNGTNYSSVGAGMTYKYSCK